MILHSCTTPDGVKHDNLFERWEDVHKMAFNPYTVEHTMIEFKIHGYSYKKKKENARQLAIAVSDALADMAISWGELATIQDYFREVGKRFGLLAEFTEKGIC